MKINREILMTIVKNSSNRLEGEQEILEINEQQLHLISKQLSELFSLNGVSGSSRKIILQLLNNSLKYGTKLLVDCDDNDEQQQIDIWRSNQEIKKAIQEIENYS